MLKSNADQRLDIPLDAKGERLLKEVRQRLDEMLAARTGTALSVAHPRLKAAIDELAKHRYAQIGVTEPLPTGKKIIHRTAEKSNN